MAKIDLKPEDITPQRLVDSLRPNRRYTMQGLFGAMGLPSGRHQNQIGKWTGPNNGALDTALLLAIRQAVQDGWLMTDCAGRKRSDFRWWTVG